MSTARLPLLPRTGSLARRLLIGAGLWSLIVLIGGAFALTALYRGEAVRLLSDDLSASLVALSRAADIDADGALIADPDDLPSDPRFETPLSGRYWAIESIAPDGRVLGDIRPPSLWDGATPIPEQARAAALQAPGTTFFHNAAGPNDERVRVAVRAIVLSEDGARAILMAAADRAEADAGARRFLLSAIGAMVVLAGGVLLAMAVQVRVVLQPLARIQTHLAGIRQGERSQLGDDYPDEVRPLTEELNMLLDHNREVVERARTHVGNLAHALKTPLAVLRNEAAGQSGLDDVVRRQVDTMHANVEHYLKRAQAAARAQALGARTEVAPAAEGLVRLLSRLFADQGITIACHTPDDLVFRGETQDLEEMMGNLLENACKWAKTKVVLTAEPDSAGWMFLRVDDDGAGLDESAMADAVKRGVRLDETAPGTGLGLSIVNELAELHGGALALSRSPLGGLRAELRLPTS